MLVHGKSWKHWKIFLSFFRAHPFRALAWYCTCFTLRPEQVEWPGVFHQRIRLNCHTNRLFAKSIVTKCIPLYNYISHFFWQSQEARRVPRVPVYNIFDCYFVCVMCSSGRTFQRIPDDGSLEKKIDVIWVHGRVELKSGTCQTSLHSSTEQCYMFWK